MSDMVPEVLNAALDSLFTPKEPGELEYQGDDGLLYCRNCHTPVQCRVKLWGRDKIVPCLCRCQQEAMAEKKRQDELVERQRKIRQLKATGIQEKHLLEWNFGVAEDNKDIQMAKRYVEQWKKVKAENLGLLLWGDVGTGKSFVAACIANALLDQGIPVLMTNFSKILNQMGAMYSEERYRYIASFSNYSLLILDDLGIERSTEYALEQVYAVIDERYKSGLPVIITTNLKIAEIRNPQDVVYARIYSRILEMCTPVRISGEDRRKSIGKEKQQVVINEDVVLSLVSEMLKAIAEYAKHDRAEFVRVVQEAQSSQQTTEVRKQRTRLAAAKQRVSDLEVLLCKIYEDNILGKLSDSRYATLDAQYEKEQSELTAEISALEKAVKSYEKHEKDADRFIALIDKYENFDKLTIAMLNEFIEKILVHERDRKGSIQTTQEVEIYFNFVGRFVPPAFGEAELTPEELEEIRKREERKDRLHQNYLKRKASGAQKRYEDKIKGRKKAEIEAKKAAIRAEDIAKGVFVPVSSLPQREPMKGVQTA